MGSLVVSWDLASLQQLWLDEIPGLLVRVPSGDWLSLQGPLHLSRCLKEAALASSQSGAHDIMW